MQTVRVSQEVLRGELLLVRLEVALLLRHVDSHKPVYSASRPESYAAQSASVLVV